MPVRRKTILYLIMIIVLTGIIVFFYMYRGKIGKIFLPFVMAIIISYMLHPLVIKLEEKNIKRSTAIILIYLVFGIMMTLLMIFIVPQMINNTRELINILPGITLEFSDNFNGIVRIISTSKWPDDIKSAIFRELNNGVALVENMVKDTLRNTLAGLAKTVSTFFDLILAMVIAYYILKDAEYFRHVSLSLVPRSWRSWVIITFREINGVLSRFIQGQLLTALIIGILETIALILVGVKYPLILGMIGGIANIIPYFGPFIGAIPAVAIALIESPAKALWTVVAFIIVQQLDNGFISPKIIEGRVGLHPVTTILAVLIGGEFFGIIGMLVSVPIAAIIKIIGKRTIEAIV